MHALTFTPHAMTVMTTIVLVLAETLVGIFVTTAWTTVTSQVELSMEF